MTTKRNYGEKVAYWMFQVILVMLTVIFFYLAPRVDSLLFPVVEDFRITEIQTDPKGEFALVWGVLTKQRGECVKTDLIIFSSPTAKGLPQKNYGMISEELNLVPNRPVGSQKWGPWKIIRPDYPLGPTINFQVLHRCNFMWETPTELGSVLTSELFPNAIIQGTRP